MWLKRKCCEIIGHAQGTIAIVRRGKSLRRENDKENSRFLMDSKNSKTAVKCDSDPLIGVLQIQFRGRVKLFTNEVLNEEIGGWKFRQAKKRIRILFLVQVDRNVQLILQKSSLCLTFLFPMKRTCQGSYKCKMQEFYINCVTFNKCGRYKFQFICAWQKKLVKAFDKQNVSSCYLPWVISIRGFHKLICTNSYARAIRAEQAINGKAYY